MKLFRKILLGASVVIILGIASATVTIYLLMGDSPFNDNEFDQQIWLSMDTNWDPDNPRGKMYEDLVENHLEKGMTHNQVIALLGTPDLKNEPLLFSYNLGMWSGFRIDYDSLDLIFSPNGKLEQYYRVQH